MQTLPNSSHVLDSVRVIYLESKLRKHRLSQALKLFEQCVVDMDLCIGEITFDLVQGSKVGGFSFSSSVFFIFLASHCCREFATTCIAIFDLL